MLLYTNFLHHSLILHIARYHLPKKFITLPAHIKTHLGNAIEPFALGELFDVLPPQMLQLFCLVTQKYRCCIRVHTVHKKPLNLDIVFRVSPCYLRIFLQEFSNFILSGNIYFYSVF